MNAALLKGLAPICRHLPLSTLMQLSGRRLWLPFYHSVQGEQALPHLHHLYPLRSVARFEADLDYCLRHFEPIDLSTLIDLVDRQAQSTKPVFHLTFDDGLREIYTLVAPVLERKGIPATFFVNPPFLDNRGLFFRYQAGLLVEQLEQGTPSLAQMQSIRALLSLNPEVGLKRAILGISYNQRILLNTIAEILEVDFATFLQEQQPYLSLIQAQDLAQRGFTFGAHSLDHPLYADLSLVEQLRQTRESLDYVKMHFATSPPSFAFPFTDDGVGQSFFQEFHRTIPNIISFGTAGLKLDQAARHLQRFPMEAFDYDASSIIPAEFIVYLAKRLLGRHRVPRS